MHTKSFNIFVAVVLICLGILPGGTARADADAQSFVPDCPLYNPILTTNAGFLRSLPPDCIKEYRKSTAMKNPAVNGIVEVFPMAMGGPDTFGYTFDDTVTYSWISATTDSGLVGDDEYTGPVGIGFDFPFYGITQTELYFSTNGLITFDSGYEYWGGNPILTGPPNNFIAPFWDDLIVGEGFGNAGAIYTMQGGTAPNRYFVIEWRNVDTFNGSSWLFSFEAILHENGDIVFQHESLPSEYSSTVGIENSLGDDGLEYQSGNMGLSAPKAIRFYYPTTSTARAMVSPTTAGIFTTVGQTSDITLTIYNTGSMGADTYDLTNSSTWSVSFYSSDGITLLTDTDTDTVIDTGSIPQGSFVNVIAKFDTPAGAMIGDHNTAMIIATSSLDISKTKSANIQIAVSAPFVNVFEDGDDGAMSFMTVRDNGTNTYKATVDNYFGDEIAVTRLANGSYIYIWTKSRVVGSYWVREVEYTILDINGNIVRPVSKLTNLTGATMDTYDYYPAVAVAPNGTIGIVWYRWLYNTATYQANYNIYFATLNGSGSLLTSPTNITNNSIWGTSSDYYIPRYYYPTIASTDDNRFILSWSEHTRIPSPPYLTYNIWSAGRSTAGTSVFAPKILTYDNDSSGPILNSLTGGKAILTWISMNGSSAPYGPYYTVINSNGTLLRSPTNLNSSVVPWLPDAVLLPNGKVGIAWGGFSGVQFSILDSNYNIETGPTTVSDPSIEYSDGMSVTTDSSSHVIMTWGSGSKPYLLYALGDSSGAFITPPMPYKSISKYIEISFNGQGNAPDLLPGVLSINRIDPSPTSAASVAFTVTFSEDVIGVDTGDFVLTTTGVTGASIIGLSGSGYIYTVTVNTGSGTGTIRLDVNDNDSILDAAGDPLGGEGNDNGDYATGAVYTITEAPTPTLPPGVQNHARDFSTPFVPPSSSASGMLPILTKPAQQAQSVSVSTTMPVTEPVSPTTTPRSLSIQVAVPTSTREPVVVMSVADVSAPETSFVATPGSVSRQRTVSFAYESTEAGTFICSLDGSAYFACDASIRFTGLSEGMHLFEVRAVDEFGNYDATPAVYTWVIERNVDIQRYKIVRK